MNLEEALLPFLSLWKAKQRPWHSWIQTPGTQGRVNLGCVKLLILQLRCYTIDLVIFIVCHSYDSAASLALAYALSPCLQLPYYDTLLGLD